MTNKHQAGVQVARQLRTVEHAVDEAMAEALRLGAIMLDARRAAGFGAALGQDALDSVLGGVSAMNSARASVVSAHGRLADIADEQDVRWRLDGATEAKPVPKTAVTPLQIVA